MTNRIPLIIASPRHDDTDSELDVYGHRYEPSAESLMPGGSRVGLSETPTLSEYPTGPTAVREPYPAWSAERNIPLSKEEIEDVFLDLANKFGFQRDSMRNMVRSTRLLTLIWGSQLLICYICVTV